MPIKNNLSFTTQRLLIRPLQQEDEALFCQLYTDAKIMRFVGPVLSIGEALATFSRSLRETQAQRQIHKCWVLIEKKTKRLVGVSAINWLQKNKSIVDVGVVLNRESNGKCFPEEAVEALIEFSFERLKVEYVTCSFSKQNLPSLRIIKKIGFEKAPVLEKSNDVNCFISKQNWHRKVICNVFND